MNTRIVLAIARKDVVDAWRNLYLLFGIALPLGFWLLFRVLLPGTGDFRIGAVAVYDQGNSRLVEHLSSDRSIGRLITARSFEELTGIVRNEAVGGLVLPADFDEAVVAERSPEVLLLMNGKRGGGELAAFRQLVDRQVRALVDRPPVANLVERKIDEPANATADLSSQIQNFTLLLLLVMGLAMTGTFVVPTLLVEEKEKGTLKAILVSPATYADVIAGKALVGLFYALLGAVILLALNEGFQGNLALLALSIVLGALMTIEFGLLLGAVFHSSAQVNTWSSVVMLLLIAPSFRAGVWLPSTADVAMRFLPTYYVGELIGVAWGGPATVGVWPSLGVLLAFVVVCFVAIVWALRRSERDGTHS